MPAHQAAALPRHDGMVCECTPYAEVRRTFLSSSIGCLLCVPRLFHEFMVVVMIFTGCNKTGWIAMPPTKADRIATPQTRKCEQGTLPLVCVSLHHCSASVYELCTVQLKGVLLSSPFTHSTNTGVNGGVT
jgi:hypothetical protein